MLWLFECNITDEGCVALTSALRSNPSHLRELDLRNNKLGEAGVKLLTDIRDDPQYKLESLNETFTIEGKRSESPDPSCVSMKSDGSMNQPMKFKGEDSQPDHSLLKKMRSESPEPSCVSMKSDVSMNQPMKFKDIDSQPHISLLKNMRSESQEPSCVSMKSDCSMNQPMKFKGVDSQPHISLLKNMRSESQEPSCVSMKSDWSMNQPMKFNGVDSQPHISLLKNMRSESQEPSCVSMKSEASMNEPMKFKGVDGQPHISLLKKMRSPGPSIVSMKSDGSMNQPMKFNGVDSQPRIRLEQTDTEHEDINALQELMGNDTFKRNLLQKYKCLWEGPSKQGKPPTLLNEIYTELYITESESGEISNEHEVRQIEIQSRRTTTEETPIKCNDIFKPLPEQHKHIRSVMTKGVAGIGKTVSVQKFILDWAEEKENQDVHLIFPLPFREINLMKDKTLSLLDLLHLFFPQTKEKEIFSDKYKVLFIFDGLDECRLSLDFHSSVRLCDVNESTSVDVMLTNLIKGNLCPSALIWITSRPAAADLIPSECVDRVTEIRGFSDPQKEEYFRKRISDESLSDQIISHLKSSRSLYIMCHIPVFCWISVTVLERILSEAERREIPKTLTQMYTHFLIIQTNIKHQKDYEKKVKDEDMIFKLGKLAFEQLVKGNLIFYDEDLRECGIDVSEASVYSGLCTQIFREEFGLYQGKVYSFVHLSIQEHLAALYVHISFINDQTPLFSDTFFQFNLSNLHQNAVDGALQSKNGHLDLFLRFLLGLSVESNQNLIRSLMTQTDHSSHSNEKTIKYIKLKISEDLSPEKFINLFHCLNELGDHSLVEEIQNYVKSKTLKNTKLSSSQWSAVAFVLLTSEQKLDEFNLKEFVYVEDYGYEENEPLKVLQKLSPVICEYRSVQLSYCNITDECCVALTSALRSNPSQLRVLDLSYNNIGDSGVKLISDILKNPDCKLEILRLSRCNITHEGCVALTSALTSNPSHLTHLDLCENNIGDSGVKLISDVLRNPDCNLEILRLHYCNITDEGCVALTSALTSNPSHLRDLDLSRNKLTDSGMKLISDVLKNPDCKLEKLWLVSCNFTDEGCAALSSALTSNPSHIRHLGLSNSNIGDSGVMQICDVLKNPDCKLEWLQLKMCNITDEGCVALTSALRSNPSHLIILDLSENKLTDSGVKLLCDLRDDPHYKLEELMWSDEGCVALTSALKSNPSDLIDLNLSGNNLGDSGVEDLSGVLKNPQCKLKKLELKCCNITAEGCVALTSALTSNPSHLRELILWGNNLGDSGVKLISDVLKNPQCKLELLWLGCCNITYEGCVDVTSALRSNPSHLRELDMSHSNLGDSGVKLISDVLKNPQCKLEILWLRECNITDKGCADLTSALRSNPSHLKKITLWWNKIGDSGVKLICDVLKNPQCKLEFLELIHCNITAEGCVALTSALRSNHSRLTHLDLRNNKLGETGVKLFTEIRNDPTCNLERLMMEPDFIKSQLFNDPRRFFGFDQVRPQ
ncbi:uncharacterized protein [Misgurnus anguillicaudatus]|uniref:uncharacterized protein isoform X1 n=1 Tax=Misgurnus anguillicaudatus TaxID=75329 RepID=UPI003CCF9491